MKEMEKSTSINATGLLEGYQRPWLARKAWRERRIVSHGARGCFFALAIPFFGIPTILCLIGALITMFKNPGEAVRAIVVGAFFGGALAVVTYWWRNWRKFGKSVCHLETLPGVIGGWFRASVEVKLPGDVTPPVKVTLDNFKIVGGKAMVRLIKWEANESVLPDRFTHIQGDRYMVPVRFQIPDRKDYYVDWQLQVKAEFPGVNMNAAFIVPIFET
jgi:hypothetical protein